jgi:predicted ATPase
MSDYLRGDFAATKAHAESARQIARTHSLEQRECMAAILSEGALAVQDPTPAALDALQKAIDGYVRTGARVFVSFWQAIMGRACLKAKEPGRGLAAVDAGITFACAGGEKFFLPELERLRAPLLAAVRAAIR